MLKWHVRGRYFVTVLVINFIRIVMADLHVAVCRMRFSPWCIKTTGKPTILFYWLQVKFEMSHTFKSVYF